MVEVSLRAVALRGDAGDSASATRRRATGEPVIEPTYRSSAPFGLRRNSHRSTGGRSMVTLLSALIASSFVVRSAVWVRIVAEATWLGSSSMP
jgi:hypothetical protein